MLFLLYNLHKKSLIRETFLYIILMFNIRPHSKGNLHLWDNPAKFLQ